jgi:hypothetical protein
MSADNSNDAKYPPKQLRSVAQYRERRAKRPDHTDDHRDAVDLRRSDVVIAPYAKCGTTWMQQTVHTLRTGGDMDFDDISRMIPFIEVNSLLKLDLDAEQRANPRAFKTHAAWGHVPEGGRYIVVFRDPGDAAVSQFRFLDGMMFERDAVAVDDFVQQIFLADRNYFTHLRSWFPKATEDDTLILTYDRMLLDPASAIRRVADFIGIPLPDDLLATTLRSTSREFMLEYGDRFNDQMMIDAGVMPAGSDAAKVTSGSSSTSLNPESLELLAQVWSEEVTATLGFESYSDLVDALVRVSGQD